MVLRSWCAISVSQSVVAGAAGASGGSGVRRGDKTLPHVAREPRVAADPDQPVDGGGMLERLADLPRADAPRPFFARRPARPFAEHARSPRRIRARVRTSSVRAHRISGGASPSPLRPSSMRRRRPRSPESTASDSLNTSGATLSTASLTVSGARRPAVPAAPAFAVPGAPPAGCPRPLRDEFQGFAIGALLLALQAFADPGRQCSAVDGPIRPARRPLRARGTMRS